MDILFKTAAGVLVAVVIGLTLSKQGKDITLLLSLVVCCMVAAIAFTYLQPVFQFIEQLQSIAELNSDVFNILLKSVGISILVELTSLICTDASNAALGKVLQFLAAAAILWMAIPLFDQLITLIGNILENV